MRVNQRPGTQWVSHTKDCDSAREPRAGAHQPWQTRTVKVAVNIGMGKPGMTRGSSGTPRKLC